MQCLNLLEQWGLSKFAQNFIDEGITDDSFSLLDDKTIQELFDKAGPRLIFKQKYNGYLSSEGHHGTTEGTGQSHDQQSIYIPGPSGCSTPVDTSSASDFYVFEPDKELLKILDETDNPPVKKIRRSSVFSTDGLEELLTKSTDGRVILMNRHKLNNDMRQKLSKLIINDLFSREECTEIKRDTFMKAADEIINLFPGEQRETSYIPYCSAKTGLRMPARGKLWSKYVNIKAALRIANQSLLSREIIMTRRTVQ
ncbi:unnamed protein product [Phaedon cochleariae]|uniref:SAM domain-containing protein n=1 Tax=Phaedon cochleariae TaxID=80249 RepID=A0A9P0GVY4_PHACE|nr:unnamed protein product [Phaedon cochleariae]